MEGNIVDIPLKGIARAGSNQSCEDGLCNEIIGLEWKEGSYVPVGVDKYAEQLNSPETLKVWKHKTTDKTNTLCLVYNLNNSYDIYWEEGNVKILEGLKDPIEKIGIVNNTIRIQDRVYLFYNDKYNELNIYDINFSMQLDVRRNGVALLHDWCDEKVQEEFRDDDDTWKGYWMKGALKQLESDVKDADYLTGMAYMCYAIKLYDGTYVKSSSPVLVCDTELGHLRNFESRFNDAPNSINLKNSSSSTNYGSIVRQIGYLTNFGWRYEEKSEDFEDAKFDEYKSTRVFDTCSMRSGNAFLREDITFNNPKSVKSMKWTDSTFSITNNDYDFNSYGLNDKGVLVGNKFTEVTEENFLDINGYSAEILKPTDNYDNRLPNGYDKKDIVWSYDTESNDENWFANKGKSWYESDYSFHIPSEYIYSGRGLGIYYDGGEQKIATKKIHQLFASRNLATPMFKIINSYIEPYKNIITSVDVFMTKPVSLFENKMDYDNSISNQRSFKSKDKIRKELKDSLVAFYKILEIPYNELVLLENDKIYVPYIERGRISQIEQQETLPKVYPHLDYFDNLYVFNNRLHISGIKTQIQTKLGYDLCLINCDIATRGTTPATSESEYIISVKLKDVDKIKNVYGSFKIPIGFYGVLSQSLVLHDDRIQEISILGVESKEGYIKYDDPIVIKFESVNGYAVSIPLDRIVIEGSGSLAQKPSIANNILTRNGNIFKVSSANNLIDFPLLQTYQVGNGDIIGFASSTKALSQGQFGQFPLYVFTTEGIWAMTTNGQGTYTSAEPLSREVCCNPNGILELDGAVLFTTNKGLMLLSGSEVVPFSPLLVGEVGLTPKESSIAYTGENIYKQAITNSKLVELSGNISYSDFREFVSNIDTRLSYIYDKNKVLIYNKSYDYCYLIDISTRITTKIAEKIEFDDDNYPNPKFGISRTPPDSVSFMELKSIAYKLDPDRYTQTMFQTRPIKLGTYDLKSSFRVVLRGKFNVENDKKAGLYVLGSNDTERWMYLGGTERGGSFYDLGTTIHRVSCKYFMVIYVGSISGDSKINGLEISSNVKYNNKLK